LGLSHWVEIAAGLMAASDTSLALLIDHYHGYTQFEKKQIRFWLEEFAANGSQPAQNGLCLLFLAADDGEAGKIALANNYLPGEIAHKALFLFLTEQWSAYEVLDFTHQQLNAAYESAGPALRQRILSHSRISGHTEWLQSLGDARRRRWLKDMSDADWRSVLRQFENGQNWQQAWRMITHAPPLWSVQLINLLHGAGWRPESQAEELDFLNLVSLAQRAMVETPQISGRKILKTPSQDLTAVAMRADGRSLAAGGSDNRLYLWNLPSGERSGYVISSPSTGARALALSPDGHYLAAAFADQSIRIFRIEDGQLVKSLEGHNALIRALFFHPDGRTLFSASFDGTLRAWRFPLGPEYARLQPAMGELFSAGIHTGGESLAIGGKQVQIWRWPQGAQIQALPSGRETTLQLSLAGDLPLLAGYSADHELRIWNLSSGRLLQQIDAGPQAVTTLALSPRGDLVLSGDREGALSAWNVSTSELLERMQVHEKTMVGIQWFSEAGFFSASQEGRLVIWDARLLVSLRQPLDSLNHETLANIQSMKNEKFITNADKTWIAFLGELVRWKNRFDILLEETQPIQLDEFDIEL
ncbi:WD40 repeat domain-containing protein, partial [bacterium]